ncbi:hypothetical protein PVAND_001636 [Polypedilum vanderplanki]|uniref:Alkylglycerone-phosphate synthase n=1 Tax=Polypedilum vanderplanki TaxID=319348 RepID=A0A9J6BNZ8_POLVA|nr:hypothetical protein PVAND_001636 [Polypedilum vanderplanki]
MSKNFDTNIAKTVDQTTIRNVESVVPKKRQELLKIDGWGYNDSKFYVDDYSIFFSGSRYAIGNDVELSNFRDWVGEKFELSVLEKPKLPTTFPEPILNETFYNAIKDMKMDYSVDGEDRFIRCHGQALQDINYVRTNKFKRIPDLILWPKCHDDVVKIVKLADENNVMLIPFGGGTSVSGSITCPQDEERSIVVIDTSQMNRLLWLDKENLVACFESGIIGQDLERTLKDEGLTMGHEPDSIEFSTLGGWIATRASGMKKNVYGNIEDIVIRVKMVTCKGVLERNISAPRVSCGPDFDQLILGSEGTLGVVTEVMVKVRPLPAVKKYGSLVFPNYEIGVCCLREIAKRRCQPASIRLMDNEQFHFGQSLKVDNGLFSKFFNSLKMFLLTKVKGYDLMKISVATLLFEGDKEEVEKQEKLIYEIADRYSGLKAGETNGQKGYVMTFLIAYIRDFALDQGIISESFETSVPWDKCLSLCNNVKACMHAECKKYGIIYYLVTCRVTQTYESGACVYFYFGFRWNSDCSDPFNLCEEIENKARNEILASGGSVSHHHGIGKKRAKWYKQTVSPIGVNLYKSAKLELDPKNIFGLNNLLTEEDQINFEKFDSKL